jgi:hypothetical protein
MPSDAADIANIAEIADHTLADKVNTIPFYLANESGKTFSELWIGHYTSKDSNNNLQSTIFYRAKPISSSTSLVEIGKIFIISSSRDYWSLYFKAESDDNLYGYSGNWYDKEASIKYTAVRLRVPSGAASAILLGTTDNSNYKQFGSFGISTLTKV